MSVSPPQLVVTETGQETGQEIGREIGPGNGTKRVAAAPFGLLGRFARDRSGGVAMIFALTFIPVITIIGLAVDFGRAYSVHAQTQSALDAAALAGARVAQLASSDTLNKASAAATVYFNQAKPTNVVSSTFEFSANPQMMQFTVTATSWVKTPFLAGLRAIFLQSGDVGAPGGCDANRYGCVQVKTTATAEIKSGGDGGSSVEISLMLDVTGSMCTPTCSKIDALKSAAKDLIDIVIWDDQSIYTSKVALAPFAAAINVGATLAPLIRGTVTANTSSTPQLFTTADALNDTANQPTSQWIRFTNASGSGTKTWSMSSKCVTERIGVEALTDAAPSTAFVGKGYFGTNTNTSCVVANHANAEVNAIQPLSTDKTMLKSRIDSFATGGSTAGHLGTAWAWYLLSPNWGYLFPAASMPAPYSDLTTVNAKGAPKVRKIAVLMTDGDYNINHCKGVEAKNSDQTPDINCNAENGKSLAQATSLCAAMKNPLDDNATKIEVFTVGFQVSSAARTFLTNCATDPEHYYDATTEDALKAAFRDIALKISSLRLAS